MLFYLTHKKNKFMIDLVMKVLNKDNNIIKDFLNITILILNLKMQIIFLNNFLIILGLMMIMM